MNTHEFKHLITNAVYQTKYEPIISVSNDSVYAYEALSKFEIEHDMISTEEIFRKLHYNNRLFFELEKRNKQLQVDNYCQNKKLFLNFDADIVHTFEQKKYWESFFKSCSKDIVVEITENGNNDEKSAKTMRDFSSWLNRIGVISALDDFAQDGSMFSFYIMSISKYIKIDKSFLRLVTKNKNYIPYLQGILRTIALNNQKSIIEGIEVIEDYKLAKELNVDFVQGYYFSDLIIVK